MKTRLVFVLVMICAIVQAQTSQIHVIPIPAEIKMSSGSWKISPGTEISYNLDKVENLAGMLASGINQATGFHIRTKKGSNGTIRLIIHDTEIPALGKEGYTLVSNSKGVVIAANHAAGLFYGIQTLMQLMPPDIESNVPVEKIMSVPAVQITDYPRFGWRGLMLDVSRNFFTKEEVKRYIDEMAKFKFNTFHWHLSDDNGWRVEIKSLPELTHTGAWRVPREGHFGSRLDPQKGEEATEGGYYTQDDIREIVQYAADRFITIVPEIDIPGHSMAAIASYPELSTTKNPDIKVNPGTNFAEWYGNGTFKMFIENTLNPSDEKVYEFLDKVFTEVSQLFPSPYIHVGGDECYKGFWKEDSACQALMEKLNIRHVEDLQGYFMNRVKKILDSKGKKLLGWDEILEGGISQDATVMSWRGIQGAIQASKKGYDVVVTPTEFCYLDYTQGDPTIDPPIYAKLRLKKSYSFNPLPEGADAKHILGGQGNLWTEQIETLRHAEYMTWPRGWALAENLWSPAEKKDWRYFIERVEYQFNRSDMAGVKYSRAMYDAIIKTHLKEGKMWVELECEVPGMDIYYTIDGGMPDAYSPSYDGAFLLPDGPITLRVITFRNGKETGHLITLKPEELRARIE